MSDPVFHLSDLIAALQFKRQDLPPALVDKAVWRMLTEIIEALADGGRVEIRGFGVWETIDRTAREARNPRTGGPLSSWRTGKRLESALQRAWSEQRDN